MLSAPDFLRALLSHLSSQDIDNYYYGRARIKNILQRPIAHLAYPYANKIAAGACEFELAATPDSRLQ